MVQVKHISFKDWNRLENRTKYLKETVEIHQVV